MTVSIVVASYNYGQFIEEALESIRAQTFRDWEAIIVDDGSTDDSVRRIVPFLSDSQFRLIECPHLGQPAAKNTGIAATRGEAIAFLDADDRWQPTKLQKQIPLLQQPNVGVVFSRRRLIDPDGQPCGKDQRRLYRGQVTSPMFRDNFVCFSSSLVRRSVFDQIGTFDERNPMAIDYDLWLRASRQCEFDYLDEPLVDYRMGHANLSSRVAQRLDIVLEIMRRFREEIDRPPLLDPAIADLALAETYRHRGIVARFDANAGIPWLLRSLRNRPTDPMTWKALAAALVPASLRRWRRILTGMPDWEARLRKAA